MVFCLFVWAFAVVAVCLRFFVLFCLSFLCLVKYLYLRL